MSWINRIINYERKCLARAYRNTKRLGRKLGLPGALLLFLPGAIAHLVTSDFDWHKVKAEIEIFLLYTVVSGFGLVFLGFIANLFSVPSEIDEFQTGKIRRLEQAQEQERKRQEIADGLADLMETCEQFLLERLSEDKYIDWLNRWQKWNDNTAESWIQNNMTRADLIQYRYAGLGFDPESLPKQVHGDYPRDIAFLRGKANTLRLMMKHRLYRNI